MTGALGLSVGLTRGGARRVFKRINIADLFVGAGGAWYDPTDSTTMRQGVDAASAMAVIGQPVGFMMDKSGGGNHLTQATASLRPILKGTPGRTYLEFDGLDDVLAGVGTLTVKAEWTLAMGVSFAAKGATASGQVPMSIAGGSTNYVRFLLRPDIARLSSAVRSAVGVYTAAGTASSQAGMGAATLLEHLPGRLTFMSDINPLVETATAWTADTVNATAHRYTLGFLATMPHRFHGGVFLRKAAGYTAEQKAALLDTLLEKAS